MELIQYYKIAYLTDRQVGGSYTLLQYTYLTDWQVGGAYTLLQNTYLIDRRVGGASHHCTHCHYIQ